jgi:ribosomal protein S18 acetylase RimI-like enzyme
MIRNYRATDLDWVEEIFKQNAKLLGNFFWMKQGLERGHKMIVIPKKAFCRFRFDKKKAAYVIDEIAVHKDHQRLGFAHDLISKVPKPIFLKTDTDNEKSNAFYKKEGFLLMSTVAGTKKTFNIWMKY